MKTLHVLARSLKAKLFMNLLAVSICAGVLLPQVPCHQASAAVPVYDPANWAQLGLQLLNMKSRFAELKAHTQMFTSNLEQLTPGNWAGVLSKEMTLDPSLKMGGLSYRLPGIAGQVQLVQPGYLPWADLAAEQQNDYDQTLQTLRSALEVVGEHDATITDFARLDKLRASAQSADGNLKALQNSNEIRVYTAAQVQSLRQMIATLINIEVVAASHGINREARSAAVSHRLADDLMTFHGY